VTGTGFLLQRRRKPEELLLTKYEGKYLVRNLESKK
tara:strand:+ start:859 stop:966 length:108 start_codon:yes stop_codon:yes gene_type:complete